MRHPAVLRRVQIEVAAALVVKLDATVATVAMKHFVLIYEFSPDFLSRRLAFRAEHLALARASAARGELQLGGRLEDEPTGLVLFKAESAALVEQFAQSDPYVINGVVQSYRIREWTTVVGRDAMNKPAP